MIRTITVGIDLGTTTTRVVVLELGKDGTQTIIGTGTSPSRGLRHGYITNTSEASKSIRKAVRDAEKSSGVAIKRAYASIGGISVSSEIGIGSAIVSKADSEVTELDVSKSIKESEDSLKLANKRVIYRSPISFRLDGKDVLGKPEGMKGIKLEVKTLFVTCLNQHLEDLETALYDAGIEILNILPSPVAASEVALTEKQKVVGCALVNIGAETVSIAVYENNSLIGMHVFSIGSTDITNDIALGLRIPLEEAEGIKIGSMIGNYPKKKIDEIIEARLGDIFELIENYLKKMKRSELLPAGIILTGGGASLPIVEEVSKTQLRLPSKIGTGDMVTIAKGKIRDSSWFVSYGLATLGGEHTGFLEFGSFSQIIKKIKDGLKAFGRQFMP